MEWKYLISLRNTCQICHLQALHAGIVWINCSQPTLVQAPWGGNKRSGFGRELGEWWVTHCYTSILKNRTISVITAKEKGFRKPCPLNCVGCSFQGPWELPDREAGHQVLLRWAMGMVPASIEAVNGFIPWQWRASRWRHNINPSHGQKLVYITDLQCSSNKTPLLLLLRIQDRVYCVPYHGLSALHSLIFILGHFTLVCGCFRQDWSKRRNGWS
jgi:hypothetical protein